MLGIVLRQEGFEPVFVRSGDQAIAAFHQAKPDLVLLDLMLPGKDGLEICRELRLESGVPIVMLTAKTDTVDVVLGLESGADDYITKPFSAKELVARIRARLRRRDTDGAETLRFHDIEMDVMAHQVTKDGKPVNLTLLEFELLATLARRPRQVFTREVLLEQVWGYRYAGDTRLVNVHVQRLRAKIEDDPENPRVVQTVRGVGYRIGPEGGAASPRRRRVIKDRTGRFNLARLDLRARVVLFTSAIVVGALLLLGAALHALLAKSLYTQQNFDASSRSSSSPARARSVRSPASTPNRSRSGSRTS